MKSSQSFHHRPDGQIVITELETISLIFFIIEKM